MATPIHQLSVNGEARFIRASSPAHAARIARAAFEGARVAFTATVGNCLPDNAQRASVYDQWSAQDWPIMVRGRPVIRPSMAKGWISRAKRESLAIEADAMREKHGAALAAIRAMLSA